MNAMQMYLGRGSFAKDFEQAVEKPPRKASLAYEGQDYSNEELEQEEWRPIAGYENSYSISSLGRIKKHSGPGDTILRAWVHHRGFAAVQFVTNGHTKNFLVHRLMAFTFMPSAVSVGHRDGNKLNNQLSNLFPKDTHWQVPSVPIEDLNALLNEFNSGSRRRGEIKRLAAKYSVPWLIARRFVAKYLKSTTIEPTVLEGEEWKSIPNYEGLYEASSFGRIKRVAHQSGLGWLKEGILTTRVNNRGYEVAAIRKEYVTKELRVHRLVAMAFHFNPKQLPQVNHIDGDKLNNRSDNLEWISASDNVIHALQMGLVLGKTTKKSFSPSSSK